METNIYIKRGLFRLNKKFWGKKYETYKEGRFKMAILDEINEVG